MLFKEYCEKFPEMAEKWAAYHDRANLGKALKDGDFFQVPEEAEATRASSGNCVQRLGKLLPNFFGGSADLAPSNKSNMKGVADFSKEDPTGRNMHFGIRELAMAGISNGLALHGGLIPYCATFFVFADFLRPMIRLAALMEIPTMFVFTHDSIGVGEDGPTHQPVEHLASLRAIPNLLVFRPADANEVLESYRVAAQETRSPSAVISHLLRIALISPVTTPVT